MKKDIHPEYNLKATVKCSCGNTFNIGSTVKELKVELCSACHPFYTGKQKLIDTAGRVDKFKIKAEKQAEVAEGRKGKKVKKAKAQAKKVSAETKPSSSASTSTKATANKKASSSAKATEDKSTDNKKDK